MSTTRSHPAASMSLARVSSDGCRRGGVHPGSFGNKRSSAGLAAIRELKPAHREALLLVHWEQLTYAEAAEALGCSVNAVGIRVHRAKERLRTLLGADSQADRPVPAAFKPNGVTDGS